MSYIAFDLDALNVSRDVGAAAGVPEERITHGLLRMWAWCFREKTDTVQSIQVQGFFGTAAAPALVAFGFLAPAGADFRVRGAERYLRISEARSRGGKAAAGNLIPGGPKRSASRDPSRGSLSAPAEPQPSDTLGSTSALTPSTEHRAPNTIKEGSNASASTPPLQLEALPAKAVRTRKPPDPAAEFARFLAACTEDERRVFRAYGKAFDLPDALAPDWGLLKFVRGKLQAHHVEELEAAVAGAGREKWHREKGTSLRALLSDSSKVAQLAKRGTAA